MEKQFNAKDKKLLEEWRTIFDKEWEDYYIYGAANTAKHMIKVAKDTGVIGKIKGLVVTDGKSNPEYVEEFPVVDIHKLEDRDAIILVPHAGVFKEQIYLLLKELGFHNIYFIFKFTQLMVTPQIIADVYMEKAKEREKDYYLCKSREEKEKDAAFCEKIIKIREKGGADFGQEHFYQSFERIGLPGRRPTLYRIEKYGIEAFLDKKYDVLDIGCNTGFLDMTVAPLVQSVTGVEYDASLIEIANCAKKYINADNCKFINKDFHDWYGENSMTYNVIFSFAIHHWLNLLPEEYVQKIDELLKKDGYLCFESHDAYTGDKEYEECLSIWFSKGYVIKTEGTIMDDGAIQRKYAILQKEVEDI